MNLLEEFFTILDESLISPVDDAFSIILNSFLEGSSQISEIDFDEPCNSVEGQEGKSMDHFINSIELFFNLFN